MGSTHDITQELDAGRSSVCVGASVNVDAWQWRWSWMTAGASICS